MIQIKIPSVSSSGQYPLVAVMAIALFFGIGFSDTVMSGDGAWWDVVPEQETPSQYYDSILYSEIAPKLREIEVNSNRVKINVIGKSAGGRHLFLASVSSGNLGGYQAVQKKMLSDPEKAQNAISKLSDFKVPVVILAGIGGNEYPTVDAAIRLIETLAYQDDVDTKTILENLVVLVVVVGNPDGRVQGKLENAASVDLGTDFTKQTQPETKAVVSLITEWNPVVFLDLRGFVNPMLIEPGTPWHNPNYEYDLYLKWAFYEAKAMESALLSQMGLVTTIPFRDMPSGRDDWAPVRPATYAMYHGAYAHTIQTPSEDESGVDALYAAVWGALKYASANKVGMLSDQIEMFRRGALDLPQQLIPEYLLNETPYEQYNELTVVEFPAAYVIPSQAPLQKDPAATASLVNLMLFNGIKVEKSNETFALGSTTYPKGTYIVRMDQPKRGLANTILWTKGTIPAVYPPLGQSLLWWPYVVNVSAVVMDALQDVKTTVINKAN